MDHCNQSNEKFGFFKVTYSVKYWKFAKFGIPYCTISANNFDESDKKHF